MMTPQQEAKDIYNKFYGIPLYIKTVKECCHITADKVLQYSKAHGFQELTKHWEEVKLEIDKL